MNFVRGKTFKELTTFGVGGKIRYFTEAATIKDVVEAVSFAKKKHLPVFILGGGSDILVSDDDFNGLVIKYIADKIKTVRSDDKFTDVSAEAAVIWDHLVKLTVQKNLQGIECLSGIPGTVGASPIQNIGAYGQELKDTFVNLTAYDIDNEKLVEFENEDCKFDYRGSIFKEKKYWQKFIILKVTLKLRKDVKPEVAYDSLKDYLSKSGIFSPTLTEVREAVLKIRAGKFENPARVGNAGSFFKNPVVKNRVLDSLIRKYPRAKYFDMGNGNYKLFAAWLIEEAGWKGKKIGGAAVSSMHSLVLINSEGNSTADDIYALSEAIIRDIRKKFGIKLEREVQLINF